MNIKVFIDFDICQYYSQLQFFIRHSHCLKNVRVGCSAYRSGDDMCILCYATA